jgi:hypothetical protein
MSVEPAPPPGAASGPAGPPQAPWYAKAAAIVYCVFCFELGLFLLVYPWMDSWNTNYFIVLAPGWREVLLSEQTRGAVSGLGVLNLLISFFEIYRLRRFAER